MSRERPEVERISALNVDNTATCGNLPGCRLPVDPGLKEQGWEWRCNADGAKLDHVVETYRELGFEVRIEPLTLNGLSDNCLGCKDALEQSLAVLVRRPG